MSVKELELQIYPAEVLRKKCEDIPIVTDEIKDIASQMIKIMKSSGGIGLAAPQVGLSINLIVVYVPDEQPKPLVLINPSIEYVFHQETKEEGCLSLPGEKRSIRRWKDILVKYKNIDGIDVSLMFKGLTSRCIQHEIDHLQGKLIIDY